MEEKKKSKKGIIIAILILIIIALVGVGGYFGYQIWKDSQTTGTDWGDTYLDNLEGKISSGEYENTENSSFGFFQFEESKKPAMVLNYEKENNKIMEISVLDSEDTIKSKTFETEKENELNIEMLYDIESKEYNWYEHEKKQDGTEIFTEVAQNEIEEGTELTENKRYEFTKEEMTRQEVEEGEMPSIPKFDEEFVKPNIELNETDIDLKNKDIDKKELKEKVEKAIENYKPQEENITDEVKQNVDNSLKDLETKKEEIKKAKGEKNKEVVGKWFLNSNVKSSNSNVTSLNDIFGSGLKMGDNTLTLKEDNTFEFYVGIAYNTTGNYEYKDGKISVYNITDPNYSNDLKSIENNLKFEYITYNGNEFLKLHLLEYSDVDIFFERNPKNISGNIANDDIPGMTTNKTNENQNNPTTTKEETTTSNSSSLKVGNYTLKYGTYIGYETLYDPSGNETIKHTVVIKQDGTITHNGNSGKYTVSGNYITGSNGMPFKVTGNNKFTLEAGGGVDFTYQG